MARKALLGNKIRRLRQDRGLTQQQMAEKLGISPSYLNLIEHNERPVTVPLLLKLGQTYEVDLQDLSEEDERRLAMGLREVFADATLRNHEIKPDELRGMVDAAPNAAKGDHRAVPRLQGGARGRAGAGPRPARRFGRIALAAAAAADRGGARFLLRPHQSFRDRSRRRPKRCGARRGSIPPIRTAAWWSTSHSATASRSRSAPIEAMQGAVRRYDAKAKRLVLSEVLPRGSRNFHIAYQIGLIEAKPAIDAILAEAKLSSPETETLCRVGLTNYFAGAVLMPYAPFLAAAKTARYDIELLDAPLRRVVRAGLPPPVDAAAAGRQGRSVLSRARRHRRQHLQALLGRGLPLLALRRLVPALGRARGVHDAGPDPHADRAAARRHDVLLHGAHADARRAGRSTSRSTQMAIGIGCELGHARELVYADGYDLDRLDRVSEIGVGCRLCERMNCRQRAFPPLQHRLMIDEKVKGVSAYPFSTKG